MEKRDIQIHRNVIENFIMFLKDQIKKRRKLVIWVLASIVIVFIIVIAGFIYVEHRAERELMEYETIMDRYRILGDGSSDADKTNFRIVVDDMKKLIGSSSWGFVNRYGDYVMGNMYFSKKMYNDAKNYYIKYAEHRPSDVFAPIAIQMAAMACEDMGNDSEAFSLYQGMERDYLHSIVADQIFYNLGRMYQKKKDIFKAKEYYHRVITLYPNSQYSSQAKRKLLLIAYAEKNPK